MQSRKVLLGEQHKRRREAIRRRGQTARERGKERGATLFDRQLQRADLSHQQMMAELDHIGSPNLSVTPLAVCLLEVTP
ncbi:hypothetical protein [Geodermatophilus sp. SYSU D01176]